MYYITLKDGTKIKYKGLGLCRDSRVFEFYTEKKTVKKVTKGFWLWKKEVEEVIDFERLFDLTIPIENILIVKFINEEKALKCTK